jgi:hypothetical protein
MDIKAAINKLPKSCDEITLGLYLDYSRELSTLKDDEYTTMKGQLAMFNIVEMFLGANPGDLDDILIEDMNQLTDRVAKLITEAKEFKPSDHFVLNDITYSTRKIADMNQLSAGEYISIGTLKEHYINDQLSLIPYILAILIRPASLVKDEETKKERWVQEPFNQRDIDNLEYRVKLFKEKALAKDLVPVCRFFLSGK